MSTNAAIKMETLDDPTHWPKEPIVTLSEPFEDARGILQPLVDLPMRSCLFTRSNPGVIRGNHYHKTDWHFNYVLSGHFEYYYRPAGSSIKPSMIVIKPGQLLWTPPMLEHAMLYLEESDAILFSRNGRSQEEYERDIIRVELI